MEEYCSNKAASCFNEPSLVPMREDGYIFATKLCKAAKKELNNWRRNAETKKVVKKLEEQLRLPNREIAVQDVIEVYMEMKLSNTTRTLEHVDKEYQYKLHPL